MPTVVARRTIWIRSENVTGVPGISGQVESHHSATRHVNVLGVIGDTPLVELTRLTPHPGVRLLAKLETTNPSGSSKDRIARAMINVAERRGLIAPGDTIIEPTSGNTGIALAMICRLKGYRLVAVIPENATAERMAMLEAFGAEIVPTDGARGSTGAIEVAERIAAQHRLYMPYQYGNPANPAAHWATTAREILRDCPQIDVFVAGIGSGGTLMGCARRFREHARPVTVIGCEPAPGHHIDGLRSLSDGFVPPVLDLRLLDTRHLVTSDQAIAMSRRLAREEGIFVGPSSGAVIHTCVQLAESLVTGTIIGMIFDGGWKYVSSGLTAPDEAPLTGRVPTGGADVPTGGSQARRS
jgi:cysteine synthase